MYQVPVVRNATTRRGVFHLLLLAGMGLIWWSLLRPWATGRYQFSPDGSMRLIKVAGTISDAAQLLLAATVVLGGLWVASHRQQPWATTALRRVLPLVALMPILVVWYGLGHPGLGNDAKLWIVSTGWVLISWALYAHNRPPTTR